MGGQEGESDSYSTQRSVAGLTLQCDQPVSEDLGGGNRSINNLNFEGKGIEPER